MTMVMKMAEMQPCHDDRMGSAYSTFRNYHCA